MSIRSYFTLKQQHLPELETVVSSFVVEAVKTEVKRRIDVKRAAVFSNHESLVSE